MSRRWWQAGTAGLLLCALLACDGRRPDLPLGVSAQSKLIVPEALWEDAARVVAGEAHACLLWQGQVQCWGRADEGQLDVPPELRRVHDLAAGDHHACAVSEGRVSCWGDNRAGQTRVPADLPAATAVAAGSRHSCALAAGRVHCWGDNSRGQLQVPDGDGAAVELLTAHGDNSCLSSGQDVRCWGAVSRQQQPVQVAAIQHPVALSLGRVQVCGLLAAMVRCINLENDQPLFAPTLLEPVALDSHADTSCAVVPGDISCWGLNGGFRQERASAEVLDVAVGGQHICLLMRGQVECRPLARGLRLPAELQPPPWSGGLE